MAKQVVANARIRMTNFFSRGNSEITSQQFRGGRVYTVFGSSDVDLRRATIVDEGTTITIITIFGGVRLLVPEDWIVNNQTRAVFSDVVSKRIPPATPRDQLTLSGLCLFGGVEVKS